MIIVLIILILIIAIIISSIQYYKAYARLHSHTTFNEAANREMTKIRYRNPVITCDYCGASIDTSKEKVCSQCGAEYGKDKEWTGRFKVDQDWVDDQADLEAEKEIRKAEADAKKIARRIRRLILAIILIIAGIFALASIISYFDKKNQYAESQELNEYSFENYEKADYDIVGDGVLLDHDGILIKIEGVYYDKTNDEVKIGYEVENNNNSDRLISMRGLAANGYAHLFSFFYETFRKNSKVTLYEIVYEGSTLESIIYGDFCIRDTDYNTIYDSDDCVEIKTTAYKGTAPALADGTVLYDNDKITIVGLGYDEDDQYNYEILNKTQETLNIECKDGKINDETVSVYGDYSVTLPGGCISNETELHIIDEAFTNREPSDQLSVNFEITDSEKPEYNFSTGYIPIT